MIEPFALLVALLKLRLLFAPEPLDLLIIDLPAFHLKQLFDLAVDIARRITEVICDYDKSAQISAVEERQVVA
ncbi:hypothetical protein V8J82_23575 [Gymnodinialimonas sp. 2305UL16-5]|uniref:hypothetical protein n=1 Tax=Gymnodinialimonas mytili TaxID=3126503 RepID=UPI0030AB118E